MLTLMLNMTTDGSQYNITFREQTQFLSSVMKKWIDQRCRGSEPRWPKSWNRAALNVSSSRCNGEDNKVIGAIWVCWKNTESNSESNSIRKEQPRARIMLSAPHPSRPRPHSRPAHCRILKPSTQAFVWIC